MQPPTRCQRCRTIIERDEELCKDCRFEYEIQEGRPDREDTEGPYYDDDPPFWLVVPPWRQ